MKCVNARWEDEVFRFDCPHCGVDAEVDEATLREFWERDARGFLVCPGPEGCGLEYILPTVAEAEIMKSPSPAAQTEPAPVPLKETAAAAPAPQVDPVFVFPKPAAAQTRTPNPVQQRTQPVPQQAAQRVAAPVARSNGARPNMRMAIRTFRHVDYRSSGKDLFDQTVTDFLEEVGTENIVSITPISYMDRDDKLVDYGVLVVHRRAAAVPGAAPAKTEWRD